MKQFQPKGGMCFSCENKFRSCRALLFHLMPVIKTGRSGEPNIVRCTDFKKQKEAE